MLRRINAVLMLALLCAWEGARLYFEDLRCVILDEIHTLHSSKRGDLLALDLARLQVLAPRMRRVGLSATVDDPEVIKAWMAGHGPSSPPRSERERGGSCRAGREKPRTALLGHATRIERGETASVSLLRLAELCAVVGLDLSARAYPGGRPLSDARHARQLDTFIETLNVFSRFGRRLVT